jgi:hypothetical protein
MTFEPLDTLGVGHTGVGLLADGRELGIYRASETEILDAATGLKVEPLSWHRHGFHVAPSSRA